MKIVEETMLRILGNGRTLRFEGAGVLVAGVPSCATTAHEFKARKWVAFKAEVSGYVISKKGRAALAKLPALAKPAPRPLPSCYGRV